MNNFEKIGLIVLFFISLIYSYIKPSDVVENIETKQQITIYVEGEYTKKLSFSYKPQKIIDYRQETPFKTIEDITNISGIGEKMYLKVREFLCL